MKKLLSISNTSNTTSIALLVARRGRAVLMLTHGIPKMMMLFSGAPVQFPPVLGMSAELSLGLTVFTEVICSVFLLTGFATRIATIPLIITMLVAVTLAEAKHHRGVVCRTSVLYTSGQSPEDFAFLRGLRGRFSWTPKATSSSSMA